MVIGIDITPLQARKSGVGTYLSSLLEALAQLDHDGARYAGFSTGIGKLDLKGIDGLFGSIRHWTVPTRAAYLLWGSIGWPPVDYRHAETLEVFHATNYYLPPVAHGKRLATCYDLTFLRTPQWCSPKIVGPFASRVKRFSEEADHLMVCSDATKRDAVELLGMRPDDITVIHGSVEPGFGTTVTQGQIDAVHAAHGIRPPYLLFVGTIEPRKNLVGLIRAFASLRDAIPHVLVLAGGGAWGSDAVDAAIADDDLDYRVIRTGYLPKRSDIEALYAGADGFVFPSLYEGFGLPLLEAMASDVPVLTADNSSLPEVAGEAAVYVNPFDIDSIADGIKRLVEDQDLRAELRAGGRKRVAEFSWERSANELFALYRRLAG